MARIVKPTVRLYEWSEDKGPSKKECPICGKKPRAKVYTGMPSHISRSVKKCELCGEYYYEDTKDVLVPVKSKYLKSKYTIPDSTGGGPIIVTVNKIDFTKLLYSLDSELTKDKKKSRHSRRLEVRGLGTKD